MKYWIQFSFLCIVSYLKRKTLNITIITNKWKLYIRNCHFLIFRVFLLLFSEEDFTAEEFPEEFMPPPMRDDFVIRDEVPQNNLIPDKGMHFC